MNNDDVIYYIDDNADIKQESLIEKYKLDKKHFPKGISHISDKIKNKDLDDITNEERDSWIFAFEMALTEEYKLSKEQLLSTHDWWISRLAYEVGDELNEKINALKTTDHESTMEFVDDITQIFTLEQLHSIELPELI
jgi:hypothetical protein